MRITSTSGLVKTISPALSFDLGWWQDRLAFEVTGDVEEVLFLGSKPKITSYGYLNEKGCTHDNYVGEARIFAEDRLTDYSMAVKPYSTMLEGPATFWRPRFKFVGWSTYYYAGVLRLGQSYSWSSPRVVGKISQTTFETLFKRVHGEWSDANHTFTSVSIQATRSGTGSPPKFGAWRTTCSISVVEFNSDYTKCSGGIDSRSVDGVLDEPWFTFSESKLNSLAVVSKTFTVAKILPNDVSYPSAFIARKLRPAVSPITWGDLAAIAADDAKCLNINSSMFVYQLKDLTGIVKTLAKAFKKPSPKTVGKAYLAWQYGAMQTKRDAQKIIQAIRGQLHNGNDFSIVRSRMDVRSSFANERLYLSSDVLTYKIFYDPKESEDKKLEKSLRDWDFWLSATNTWDMIPYSFVVDWLLGIDQFTEHYDRQQYFDTVDILGVTKSRRTTFEFDLTLTGYHVLGHCQLVLYDRMTQNTCDPTYLCYELPKTFSNWAEATALIMSKSRV